MVSISNGDAEQCNCMAHSAVFSTQYPSDVLADLNTLATVAR